MIILVENREILNDLNEIKFKVDYLYMKVKELEDFSNSILPLIEDTIRNISQTIESVTSDERISRIKNILKSFDEISQTINYMKNYLEEILNKLPEYLSAVNLDKLIEMLYGLKIDTEKMFENLSSISNDLRYILESKDFYEILSKICINISTINSYLTELLNMLNDIKEKLPYISELIRNIIKITIKFRINKILEEIYETDLPEDLTIKYLDLFKLLNNSIRNLSKEDLDVLEEIIKTILNKDTLNSIKESLSEFKLIINKLPKFVSLIKYLSENEIMDMMENIAKISNKASRIINVRLKDGISNDLLEIMDALTNPEVIQKLKIITKALEETTPKKYGRISILSAMGDENIQYGMGFFFEFLKNIGKNLKYTK